MAVYARARYEYNAIDPGDLKFEEGDIIEVIQQDGDWWRGRLNNNEGYFPFNRVEILRNNPRPAMNAPVPGQAFGNNPADRIQSVQVELEDKRGTNNGAATYSVMFAAQSGTRSKQIKSMHDVRRFDRALKALDGNMLLKTELFPEWADEIPLGTSQAKDRASYIKKYFTKNKGSHPLFDILAIKWGSADKHRLRGGQTMGNCSVTARDGRPDIDRKIIAALAGAYQKESKDPGRWFYGSRNEKVGDLAQANFKWDARDNTELSFEAGDYILVTDKATQFEGWWLGQKVDGEKGFFPSNYISEINQQTFKKRLKPRNTRPDGAATGPPQFNPPAFQPAANNNVGMGPPQNQPNNLGSSPARDRRIEQGFWVKSIDAYDELKNQGFSLEQQGRHLKARKTGVVKNGDFVSLSFSAYVWDPQSQQLREFSASEKLKAPPRGVQSGDAGRSGFKMEFVVGSNTAIDGLEEVVQCLQTNTPVRAILSPDKGYGSVGSPPEIPADCYLVYDLTLEKVSSGTTYRPPRNQVFSVGITRTNVQQREAMKSGAMWASKKFNPPEGTGHVKRKRRKGRPTDI